MPLVKGTTAASLAKKRAAADREEASGTSRLSSASRKRKRKDRASENNGNGNNNKNVFSSTAESLAVISEYHTLNKRLEQAENDESLTPEERQKIILDLKKQQDAMGGLDRYQKASIYGAKSSKFVCADWVVPLLKKELEKEEEEERHAGAKTMTAKSQSDKQSESNPRRLRILDVGAIDNQYFGKGYDDWLDAVPIDLHGGQHDTVLQVDFFDYAHEYCAGKDLAVAKKEEGKTKKQNNAKVHRDASSVSPSPPQPFDAIVMSLVLNFQGDPRKRGDMLALASDSRLLKSSSGDNHGSSSNRTRKGGGMLFVVLPSASLDNSRYCDLERFIEVTTNPLFQLELVEKKRSSKLILLAFRRTTKASRQQKLDDEQDAANQYGEQQKSNGKKQKRDQNAHCYDVDKKMFDYGNHEMKRLQPPKPGAKRNNFAVILKSCHNRTSNK
ncbi:unnamed protein product [Pseudo-nitzschia multistriata]|uniref:Uncharacterized protein n=1 Tax=Pseudo-nitzschia multistriata TaxID=183589 RepID=A0A448ZDT2_9STRA|nr:unnamed protein product [Pseudo-nitzschia multistriata]